MTFQRLLSLFTTATAMRSALSQTSVGFDAAAASNSHPGDFKADNAMLPGSGYWCSAGHHVADQTVTWTGLLNSRHTAVGLKINWAYSPGEYKLLSSTGGGNFEEIACWRTPSQKTASCVETVMFEAPVHVKELTIVMRDPMPWHYFGLNDISLLVEPYPFMIVNGASTTSKESCLVSSGTSLKLESCLSAVAAGDGREVFEFTDDAQIVSSTTGRCITLVNGDIQDGGKIALEKCRRVEDTHDGHSAWSLTASGQLMLTSLGNYCLDTSGPSPAVQNCGAEAHHVSIVAVPKFDPNGSTQIKDTAALLMASVGRQSVLSAKLQNAMPLLGRCAIPASFVTNASMSLMKLGRTNATSVVPAAGAAMEAIAEIYPAMGVDMSSVKGVIANAADILNTVHGKVTH